MRRRILFILKELPMLRARPLRAASAAPPPPRAAPPIYETSHQIRENSHSPLASHFPALTPRPCFRAPVLLVLLLALLAALAPTPAHAQALSAACPVNGYTAAATQATGGQNLVCSSLTWHYVPYQFGASAGTCPGASNVNLGIIQWTGAAFQGCTASGWGSLASGGATALSALVAATATNSINNVNFAQTWTWGTLGANTALSLTSTDMTTGTLLNLSNTDTAANAGTVLIVSNSEGGNSTGISSTMLSATNTGYAGYFSNATTNTGYAVYGVMTAHGNTGYAGYFKNTDTSSNTNYGIYGITLSTGGSAGVTGECDAAACQGVWGTSTSGTGVYGVSGTNAGVNGTSNSTSAGYGVYGQITGHGNTGYAGYFINTDTSSNKNFGVAGYALSSNGSTAGVYGESDAANTQGVYGYSTNGAGVYAQGGGYGVYATTGSGTALYGYASSSSGTTYGLQLYSNTTGSGYGVYSSIASTGAGYGVYSTITGHGNTGYAGYFSNTDTSNSTNYGVAGITGLNTTATGNAVGVYGEGDCYNCYGGYFTSINGDGILAGGSYAGGYFVSNSYGTFGVYATSQNTGTGYGVYAQSLSTGAGYGVYGTITGHGNTGYAGYFSNTDTSSATNYGIYASVAGSGGTAGYFNGGKLQVTNTTAFNPTTMPIDSVVVGSASANGCAGDGVFMSDTTTVGDGQGFIAYLGGSTYIGQLQSGNCYLGITFSNSGYIGIWNGSPSATFDVGLNGTTTGNIRLEGHTSGYVQLSPSAAAGSWTMTLPTAAGTSGYVLSTDGTGVTSWIPDAGTASTALSGITAGSATNTINSTNKAQVWNWTTLSTQTALTISNGGLTTGTLLALTSTSATAGTGVVLNVSDSQGGNSTGISSTMLSATNTGYAGYFSNATTNAGYAVYGTMTAHNNTGYAGFFQNTSTGGYAGFFTNTATTGGPNAIVSIYSNNYPAGQDKLDVGDVNGTDLSIDQWGNTYFSSAIYYIGYDNNYGITALSTNSVPLYITTDGAAGANDNIYLTPNGTGYTYVSGSTVINNSNLNNDVPLYVDTNAQDASIAINRQNDTADRAMIRLANALPLSTTVINWYVGEQGGDYGFAFNMYNGTNSYTPLYVSSDQYVGIGTNYAWPQAQLDVQGSIATGTISVEDEFHITRTINTGVAYPQLASFQLGSYAVNSSGNGYGPATRLDIDLKAAANSNLTGDTNVMTLLSDVAVGIGTTAPAHTLDVRGMEAANGIISNGTTFTISSGCGTPTNLTGGATTGSFKAKATTCTAVIVLPTAPNGWWCSGWDVTTTADTLKMTTDSTTSCTLSGTVATNDIIVFHAEGF
jgi:hypothetical protein